MAHSSEKQCKQIPYFNDYIGNYHEKDFGVIVKFRRVKGLEKFYLSQKRNIVFRNQVNLFLLK